MPFLENVLRGKNVPRERMLKVAEHYYRFGGKSPINEQNRQLISALESELTQHGPHLPVYWGNRNWHPMLTDTLRKMKEDGVRRALALVTSAYSSYSGCRQFREDIARAQQAVGEGAPIVDKIRAFFNHPGFIEAAADRVKESLERIPQDRREAAHLKESWWRRSWDAKDGGWCIRAEVGQLPSLGCLQTSYIASAKSTYWEVFQMLSSRRSVLCRITWRFFLIWTQRQGTCALSWA